MGDQADFFLRVFLGRIAGCCVRILFMYIRCSYVNTDTYVPGVGFHYVEFDLDQA